MPIDLSRRQLLVSSAAAATVACGFADTATLAAPAAKPPATATTQRKLNIGAIGIGGRGLGVFKELLALGNVNMVGVCDVDAKHLVRAARLAPDAEAFVDFREMLGMKGLDAVMCGTPDHTHAVITAAALRAGKHVYCEKPLCHTIAETRAIMKLADETGLVTQLGIQIHSGDNYRRVVELIRAGAIGAVKEVHIWNDRQHNPTSRKPAPPPAALNFDLWLGPVPQRPFLEGMHPYSWRQWWAFASGMLGDIGCHLMDVAFWALDLDRPTRISATGEPRSDEFVSDWNIVTYDFAARGELPPVTLTWYDRPHRPPTIGEWLLPEKLQGEGVMFVGERGMVHTNYGSHLLLPEEKFKDFKRPATTIASSPGHPAEWVNACLANDPKATGAPFHYGGRLTETVLLGIIAFRTGKTLEWDAASMKFPNTPDAERYLTEPRRDGWSL